MPAAEAPTLEATPSRPVSPEIPDAETRILLQGVSWETYERLLAEQSGRGGKHFTYDNGSLQIMVLSVEHARLVHLLAIFVEFVAAEWGVNVYGASSTTFQRRDLQKGFEPDACFYFQHLELVRTKARLDLSVDPPPDLLIEIDVTHSSLPRQPLFAAFGVPELWRWDGRGVRLLRLEPGGARYAEVSQSVLLPPLDGAILTRLLEESRTLLSTAWTRRVREWAQAQLASGARVNS